MFDSRGRRTGRWSVHPDGKITPEFAPYPKAPRPLRASGAAAAAMSSRIPPRGAPMGMEAAEEIAPHMKSRTAAVLGGLALLGGGVFMSRRSKNQ